MKDYRGELLERTRKVLAEFEELGKDLDMIECLKVYRQILNGEQCPCTLVRNGRCAICDRSLIVKSVEDLPPFVLKAINERKNRAWDWGVADFIESWNKTMRSQQEEIEQ